MKRVILAGAILCCSLFTISCMFSPKKIEFYSVVPVDINASVRMPIIFGGFEVGKTSKIQMNLTTKEKRIYFYIYQPYYFDLAKDGNKLSAEIDDSGNIKSIKLNGQSQSERMIREHHQFDIELVKGTPAPPS